MRTVIRWIVIPVVEVHGLIHLLGAAKGLGWAKVTQLSEPISGAMGVAWLVPPYRWLFDARAVEATGAVAFDARCLRGKCDEDPRLGYELMQRVPHVMFERLVAARVRLLDLHGNSGATGANVDNGTIGATAATDATAR